MMLADKTQAGLRMISYAYIEIQKNVLIEGRLSVDDMGFDWKSETNGDQLTKLPLYCQEYAFGYQLI